MYDDFVNILGGHHITGLILGVISMHFMVKVQIGIFFFLGGGGVGGDY